MEKVAIFVDVQNIYYTVADGLQGQFDYNHFWSKIKKSNCQIVEAYAYAIDRKNDKQIQFQNISFRMTVTGMCCGQYSWYSEHKLSHLGSWEKSHV